MLPWLHHTDDFANKPTLPATLTPENRLLPATRCPLLC
jgi:hypothetical protein